jgi:glutathione S-transferase
MILYGHAFSSYTWKAMIAFHEKGLPYEFRQIDAGHEDVSKQFFERWPIGKFPLLVAEERQLMESSIIIEYLDLAHPETTLLIPADADDALTVRMMDRIFDNYVMAPVQRAVGNALLPEARRDALVLDEVRQTLSIAYSWLDGHMHARNWAAHEGFSLADCAAAPSLFYADWVHPITEDWPALKAYRARLCARPSVERCIEEARPYRAYFPLGAPVE